MIPFYVSLHFSMIGVVQFYNLPELQNSIANVNYWFVLMFVVMVTYFIIYAIIKAVHTAAQKKEERFEY
jgi:phosphotransferase system  glucose/maltose/N-acetylglucosamine-specific IIC component